MKIPPHICMPETDIQGGIPIHYVTAAQAKLPRLTN